MLTCFLVAGSLFLSSTEDPSYALAIGPSTHIQISREWRTPVVVVRSAGRMETYPLRKEQEGQSAREILTTCEEEARGER